MLENIIRVWMKYWNLFLEGLGYTLLLSFCYCFNGMYLRFSDFSFENEQF